MCARLFLAVTDEELAEFLDLGGLPVFAPRYNIAPGQDVLAVRSDESGRAAALLRWGLVPRGTKDPAASRWINARSESAGQRPAFRESLRERRCVVPASGFYEWKKAGRVRQPYAIRSRAGLVTLAGLWDRWERGGRALETFTVLTTAAHGHVAEIHDRMPVVLEREQIGAWLDPTRRTESDLVELLRPYPAERLTVQAVSTRVNTPAFDDALCLEPDTAPAPSQGRLF